MMTYNFLSKPKKIPGINKNEDHLYQMMQTLGPIVKEYAINGSNSSQYFNKKGKLLNGNPKEQSSLLSIPKLKNISIGLIKKNIMLQSIAHIHINIVFQILPSLLSINIYQSTLFPKFSGN